MLSVILRKALDHQLQRGLQRILSVVFRDPPVRQMAVDINARPSVHKAAQRPWPQACEQLTRA